MADFESVDWTPEELERLEVWREAKPKADFVDRLMKTWGHGKEPLLVQKDREMRRIAELKNRADGLIYTTEKALEEYASMLESQDVATIRRALELLKAVYLTESYEEFELALERLEHVSHKIAEAMYAATEEEEDF